MAELLLQSWERGVGGGGLGWSGEGFKAADGVHQVFDGHFAVNEVEGDTEGEAAMGDLEECRARSAECREGELAEAPVEGAGGDAGFEDEVEGLVA